MRKINFFILHILIGAIILFMAFITSSQLWSKSIIAIVAVLFFTALIKHFKEVDYLEKKRCGRECMRLLLGSFLAASITWYINHRIGFGPIVANGLVGLIASGLFPKNAAPYYIASFIGMSAVAVIPSMWLAGLGGIVAGLIIVFSNEVYNGIGGKGGTVAAISTQLLSFFAGLFV